MASKVHPQAGATITTSSEKQLFTLWMKSLIINGNGCAAFDSTGRIAYRVDNYGRKCSHRVLLMDLAGDVLFTIIKRSFGLMARWEGYGSDCRGVDKEKPRFWVRKIKGIKMILGFFKRLSFYKVVVRADNIDHPCDQYVMEHHRSKPYCRIIDGFGRTLAEVKRKRSEGGIVLGEDVLAMVVEPNVDHCLIMALVVLFGLLTLRL
ncbi:protein LURP-one-related 11-like [Andrographis paniculata]|uniref:protein LURP-one-related 11-like n=1 Tax=Andrographis paniculata TaxID=175694 RepID=UPI0021E85BB6|nr:protein LURP-one-related 11-like [Andrographis paniculata]